LTRVPQTPALSQDEIEAGVAVARQLRAAVFVVCYNHEAHIEATLRRIPASLWQHLASVYVIDDSSQDATRGRLDALVREFPKLHAFTTPFNQGYGGNQKLGYQFAIRERFDVVVLLHGDGQYAPEVLPRILRPFADPTVAAVFGSRMLERGAARRGGMPLYKFVGNRILTAFQNRMLGSRLSEFHSGYRAYRVSALAGIPFALNTNDFHFDTEIIVQLLASKRRIVEVPIPTYYGDEICYVNGIAYAGHCLRTVAQAVANRLYLVYHPKFDVEADQGYQFKRAPNSLHQHVLGSVTARGRRVVELGTGNGDIARALAAQGASVVAVDQVPPPGDLPFEFVAHDLDQPFVSAVRPAGSAPADLVIALDVLEHLSRPERAAAEIQQILAPGGELIASTGNIAYLVPRLALLLGQFNYGKKGILDLTHKRLFTLRSFRRLLEGAGFRIESVRGFGPPIEDMVGQSWFLRTMDRVAGWLARVWPSLFAYQFVVRARRVDDVEDILRRTLASGST
jgi:glycosyltransferase involved in cell wall biosynthesis